MKLLIDIGNTNTSIGIWHDSKLSLVTKIDNSNLFNIWKNYYRKSISEVFIISVISNNETKSIKDRLKKISKCEVTHIKSSPELFGIVNGYDKPTQLGDDRWVTVVASYLKQQSVWPTGWVSCIFTRLQLPFIAWQTKIPTSSRYQIMPLFLSRFFCRT